MGCEFEQFQVNPYSDRSIKEIEMHLINGKKIKLSLLDADIFYMANGDLFIVGKTLDKKIVVQKFVVHSLGEDQWKQ